MDQNPNNNAPPPPAGRADNTLPQAMTALAQAMTTLLAQLQAVLVPAQQAQAQVQPPTPAQWARIKTHNPDPYNRSDPSNLHSFLSVQTGLSSTPSRLL